MRRRLAPRGRRGRPRNRVSGSPSDWGSVYDQPSIRGTRGPGLTGRALRHVHARRTRGGPHPPARGRAAPTGREGRGLPARRGKGEPPRDLERGSSHTLHLPPRRRASRAAPRAHGRRRRPRPRRLRREGTDSRPARRDRATPGSRGRGTRLARRGGRGERLGRGGRGGLFSRSPPALRGIARDNQRRAHELRPRLGPEGLQADQAVLRGQGGPRRHSRIGRERPPLPARLDRRGEEGRGRLRSRARA